MKIIDNIKKYLAEKRLQDVKDKLLLKAALERDFERLAEHYHEVVLPNTDTKNRAAAWKKFEKNQLILEKKLCDIGKELKNVPQDFYAKVVSCYPEVFFHIPEDMQTEQMVIDASKEYPLAVLWAKDESWIKESMWIDAIKRDILVFSEMPESAKTPEICKTGVEKDPEAIAFVPASLLTKELVDMVKKEAPNFPVLQQDNVVEWIMQQQENLAPYAAEWMSASARVHQGLNTGCSILEDKSFKEKVDNLQDEDKSIKNTHEIRQGL